MPYKIEVEGADGSGKSTAVQVLYDAFRSAGQRTMIMSEAGFHKIDACVQMKKMALDPSSFLSPLSMELLFAAQRVENDLWIKNSPEAQKYDIILSDRGYVSHLAYGYPNVSREKIDILFRELLNDVTKPNVILYLGVSADVAMERIRARGEPTDRIEGLGKEHQAKVIENYESLLSGRFSKTLTQRGGHILQIDANRGKKDVQDELRRCAQTIVDMRAARTAKDILLNEG